MRSAYYVLVLCLFLSCSEKQADDNDLTPELQFTFLKDTSIVNPLILGVWKSIGNGYYLEAREDSILLYSYTKNFCYKEKNDYLEGLLNSQSQFYLRQDTLGIYLTDYGGKTQSLQVKKDFTKVDRIPDDCIGFSEMTALNSPKLFELYIQTLSENYAFSQRRNLDWASILDTYRDSISSADESLFETMGKVATLTKDQHTKVINQAGRRLQYRITPSARIVQDAFEEQSQVQDLNDYFNLYFETNYKNIADSLLLGNGKKVLNGQLEWGNVNDRIGYINIYSFAGFASRENSRKQQIDSINYQMIRIIESFADMDAIIIDISFNFGGYDASGLTIASYFTDKPVFAYTQQVYNNGNFYQEQTHIPLIIKEKRTETF